MSKSIGDKSVWLSGLVAGGSLILLRVVPGFLLALTLLVVAWLLASWWSHWYRERQHTSTALLRALLWANVITWILPPIGFFVGFATITVSYKNEAVNRKQSMVLGWAGIALSFANTILGAYLVSR